MRREPQFNGKTAPVWFDQMKALDQTPALDALRAMGKNAVPTVEKALRSPRPNDRYKAAWALGQLGPVARDAAPSLIKVMDDENNSVRYYAVLSMDSIDPFRGDLIPVLIKRLGDTNKSVSSVSAALLNKIDQERKEKGMSPPFTNEFDYDLAFVRSRAPDVKLMGIQKLRNLQDQDKRSEVVETLQSLATNENRSVQMQAQMALRALGVTDDAPQTNN